MPDRLSSLLTRFSTAARVDRTGALRDTAAFDLAQDAGRLHLLRGGSVQALHAGWTPLKLVRPSLLFYPRPFEHRLQPVDGTAVNLMSAAIRFAGGSVNPLASSLPPLLVLPLEALIEARTTITQLFDEADGARCGHRIALDRLCDLLLVQVLRHVIDRALASSGMLAGLADRRLSRALVALHDQPQRDWHLEDLAARAGMSRARFAARFKEKVGIAPGEYLTRWRISLAQHLLEQGRPVKEVAGEVGYASPAALGRVFATRTGVTPKAWANARSRPGTHDATTQAYSRGDSTRRGALRREPTAHTPVWLMRQAGRYLPEYNATRARAGSFLALCKTPELACEVTLQPLARFPLDAAILFSDILTVPDAMGLGLYFAEGEGPRFERPVRDEADVRRLAAPDPSVELRYVTDAVRTVRAALAGRVPLIGFAGSPWTLACYMVEGGGSTDFRRIKTMLYERPDLLARLLAVNADAVAAYLNAQVEAGAQALMLFDSWGGALADGAYQQFSLAPMRRVLAALVRERDEPLPDAAGSGAGTRKVRVPVIVFTKGGGLWLEDIADIGCDAIGVDWTVNLSRARDRVGARCAIQGNLDPMALMAAPAQVRAEAIKVLDAFGAPREGSGHVFNLGHGISQFTPPESVSALVEAVHAYSRRQRANEASASSL